MIEKEGQALDFFIGGSISVEFDEDVPEAIMSNYNIPINDTAYVDPEVLEYPIKDAEDFFRKVIATRKK